MGCDPRLEPVLITGVHRGPAGTIAIDGTSSPGVPGPVLITNAGDLFAGRFHFTLPAIDGGDGDPGERGPSGDLRSGMLLLGGM